MAARAARSSLLGFTEYTLPQYRRAAHHELIAEKLEAVERGDIDRLMIFMPPRHGKSELASKRFPAWCLGRNPKRQIIAASYNSDLASDFGRNVRNIVAEPEYSQVFPGVTLSPDSQAANRFNTNAKGTYVAAGVGTAVTGRGADIALIDDPFKDREEADSERRRELVWDWYRSTLYTRLMPGGKLVLIQCMTGDTPVLMADGHERPLRDVRPGDMVATYDGGVIRAAKVMNWANQGPDRLFTIRMKSGKTVRANARHPFLVVEGGQKVWRRTDTLRVGQSILTVTGVSGGVFNAPRMGVAGPQSARAYATRTTTRGDGLTAFAHLQSTLSRGVKRICDIVTELTSLSMSACWQSKAAFVPSASSRQAVPTRGRIGTGSFASITAMMAGTFAGYSAMTATLRSDTASHPEFCGQPLNTLSVTPDEIAEITEGGVEDVFDVQIERTENFIANGLVSHNTRWHEDDLAGRLLEQEGDQWEVLELPALHPDRGALWPEWYDEKALLRIKETIGPREWSALYQQQPQPDEGTFFKREWFNEYEHLPACRFYGTSDYAVTDGGGDYTVLTIWGIAPNGDIYRADQWKGQASSDKWIEAQLDLIAKYKPLAFFGEGGVIQKAIEPMLRRRMRERNVYCRLEWLPSVADKPTRARSFQAMAATGRVHFERGADLSDFLVFPAGKHDDEVDTASLIGRAIDQAHPAIVQAKAQSVKRDGYWPKEQADNDWMTV